MKEQKFFSCKSFVEKKNSFRIVFYMWKNINSIYDFNIFIFIFFSIFLIIYIFILYIFIYIYFNPLIRYVL